MTDKTKTLQAKTVETDSPENDRAPLNAVRNLGKGMKDASRHVWLAGLGAIGTVDQQSRGWFADLVSRGRNVEDREWPVIEKRFRRAGERLDSFRQDVEKGVEGRVTTTLQRLGVPGRGEVQQLIERVEALTRKVESLAVAPKS